MEGVNSNDLVLDNIGGPFKILEIIFAVVGKN
jgi:hypothetical protein